MINIGQKIKYIYNISVFNNSKKNQNVNQYDGYYVSVGNLCPYIS